MSKVVCDVCGTAFADNVNQCPICGTAKSETARPVGGGEEAGSGYAYVKGGRFSQANVRKHNSGKKELRRTTDAPRNQKTEAQEAPKERPVRRADRPKPEEPENQQPSNIGLIIIVVVLLLAILSLCAYIAVRYIDLNNSRNTTGSSSGSSSSTPIEEVPCTGISIDGVTVHTFNNLTDELLIGVTCEPANTTDLISWNYDSTVVKVVQSGAQWIVSPVGPGEAVITVSCGAFSDTLTVTSNVVLEPEPTDPTNPTDPTDPEFVLELVKADITMTYFGETAKIYDGAKDAAEITWYSDDETVCTIANGVVTAVGAGKTNVYGVYGDQIVTCIVRCTDAVVEPVEPEYFLYTQYGKLNSYDVTISIGETLVFSLRDGDGVKITEGLVFTVSDDAFITVDANGRVKGVASTGTTKVYLYVEYEGVVYECRVRVRSAN